MLRSGPGAGGAVIGERELGPVPRGHVRVRVAFAGVNHIDLLLAGGKLPLSPRPVGLGLELAGTVEGLGEGARGPAVGARVVAMGTPYTDAFVELADVEARRATLVPDGLPLDRAAASIVNYATAWVLLRERARVAPGEAVLVHGAAGGVGTAALQLARHLGARPIALVGDASKVDHAKRNGAAAVIVHGREGVAARARALTEGRGVDVVLNATGGATLARDLRLLAPFGRLTPGALVQPAEDPEAYASGHATLNWNPWQRCLLISRGRVTSVHRATLPRAAIRAAQGSVRLCNRSHSTSLHSLRGTFVAGSADGGKRRHRYPKTDTSEHIARTMVANRAADDPPRVDR
ncbi:MAG TPA: zinc-binding dehydrogenase [Sorangium sp.]|nr:zinc-binding dehydrogenase [Sorangium sp.]